MWYGTGNCRWLWNWRNCHINLQIYVVFGPIFNYLSVIYQVVYLWFQICQHRSHSKHQRMEHSIILLVTADKSIEQVTESTVFSTISGQVPQLVTTLYLSVEQLESTVVQLKTSCLGLTPTNWMLERGGGGSKDKSHNNISYCKCSVSSQYRQFQVW